MPNRKAATPITLAVVKTACSNCNLHELCLPLGLSHAEIEKLDEVVSARHRIKRGELRAIDEDLTVAMYYALVDEAAKHGYAHYELSNWARPGYESRHNLKYWMGAPYWAFGVSAAGYDGQSRWSNTRNLNQYLQQIESGASPIAERTELDDDEKQSEALFLKLRLQEGVDLRAHQARFGVNVQARYADELERLQEAGLIEISSEHLKISRAGMVLANEVFQAFV